MLPSKMPRFWPNCKAAPHASFANFREGTGEGQSQNALQDNQQNKQSSLYIYNFISYLIILNTTYYITNITFDTKK